MQTTVAPVSQTSETPVTPVKDEQPQTVEIMKIIKEAQQQHGLRHTDYSRYRTYCSRRVRRLRKTLHLACGNVRRFQRRDITLEDLAKDVKCLLVPLFQAERAWALAMELKQEANTEPRKKFHLVSRLRKACKFAAELEKLSQSSNLDARTKLEAQGYVCLINGQYYFEVQKWKESLQHFNVAKKIYEKLSETLKGDDAQVFYTQKVDEIVPNIRYCNYNLGDETAKTNLGDIMNLQAATGSDIAENIDALIAQTEQKKIQTFSEVNWRNGIVLQVKNEKVKIFLLKVQEFDKQIEASDSNETKITIYENILKESVDAIQAIRDELKLDQHFQALQRGQVLAPDDKPSNTLLLFSYLTWTRLSKTIERNLLMVDGYKQQASVGQNKSAETAGSKQSKPQDIVRIYEIILQNLKEMSNLPGLTHDKKFIADSELLTAFYKCFRAYYISMFYLSIKKYKEAVGFFFRVEKYLESVRGSVSALDASRELYKRQKELGKQLDELAYELNQSKYKIQTAAILEDAENASDNSAPKDGDVNKDKLSKIPLNERLDVYFEDTNLVSKTPNVIKLPIPYEPIPCKPLFFDLALNHLELPSYEDKIDVKKAGAQQQGVKGLIKGLFGFGK